MEYSPPVTSPALLCTFYHGHWQAGGRLGSMPANQLLVLTTIPIIISIISSAHTQSRENLYLIWFACPLYNVDVQQYKHWPYLSIYCIVRFLYIAHDRSSEMSYQTLLYWRSNWDVEEYTFKILNKILWAMDTINKRLYTDIQTSFTWRSSPRISSTIVTVQFMMIPCLPSLNILVLHTVQTSDIVHNFVWSCANPFF